MLWQRGKQDTHGLPCRWLLSSAKNNYKNSLQKLWQKSEASATNTHNILKPWARTNGSKQKPLVVWCSLSWSKEHNSSSHHSCRNTACGWTSGNRKGKRSARRVSDPEDHPWVEPLCWFKTCTSGVVEKRLIYSIIAHQHEEYHQDGNSTQNSKKHASGHMPLSQSLKTDHVNQQVFLQQWITCACQNSGLVFSGSWGLQTLTVSSSKTSETKNPKPFFQNPKSGNS